MNHTRYADWVTIWVVHLPQWTETGGFKYRIGLDCAGRASLAHRIRISACFTWTDNSFLAYRIRISTCFTWTDNSFLPMRQNLFYFSGAEELCLAHCRTVIPSDGFFYPHHTPMNDKPAYNLTMLSHRDRMKITCI